jgi:4-amino-4-deoxy-L-arabinose transferase-like glycosyltransferase
VARWWTTRPTFRRPAKGQSPSVPGRQKQAEAETPSSNSGLPTPGPTRGPGPGFARWMLALILLTNASLGGWQLSRAGWQNIYYAAGVFSGSQSWQSFFFVGLDPAGGATVDKPPLAFWLVASSAWVFGFNSWSMLLPQIVISVLTSAVLFALVRRLCGVWAALLAAGALTVTPVSVWMSHGNYPDPLMVLLMTSAGYCAVRALPRLSMGG